MRRKSAESAFAHRGHVRKLGPSHVAGYRERPQAAFLDERKKDRRIWPPSKSATAGAAPLYGMKTILLAVLTRNSSRQTCGPMPTVAPDVSLPGLALAYCTSSCSVFAGTAGWTTRALESNAIRPTPAKSLIGSKSSVR